jgi:hypothetical protein
MESQGDQSRGTMCKSRNTLDMKSIKYWRSSMPKVCAFFVMVGISFSVFAQTDAQLDQIRAEARKAGVGSLLTQMAQMKANVRSQDASEIFEPLDRAAKGTVMTTTWRAKNVEFKDIDRAIEFQSKTHTLKTICSQKVLAVLIKEFGATMLSRFVDKNNRLMWEVRVDKENCNQLQAIEALNTCNMIAIEAMKTMTRETEKTRRSLSDCEADARGKILMIMKVDYKRQPGKYYDDLKVEIMGADAFVARSICNSPLKKVMDELNYDYRIETTFEGGFITASTVSSATCASISSDKSKYDPKSIAAQDKQRMETLLAIETLGIERYLMTMAESAKAISGQNVDAITKINSASVANKKLVYEYTVTANRESIDFSRLEVLRANERANTCNEQTSKILISLFDVGVVKRYSDSKGEFLFETSSSREECRRVWRQ